MVFCQQYIKMKLYYLLGTGYNCRTFIISSKIRYKHKEECHSSPLWEQCHTKIPLWDLYLQNYLFHFLNALRCFHFYASKFRNKAFRSVYFLHSCGSYHISTSLWNCMKLSLYLCPGSINKSSFTWLLWELFESFQKTLKKKTTHI